MKNHKGKNRNPYEKIFDDAKRKLDKNFESTYMNRLESYQDSDELEAIPFPYGGKGSKNYNIN